MTASVMFCHLAGFSYRIKAYYWCYTSISMIFCLLVIP